MAKIECYNCKDTTNAVAPRYRCEFCNYPLFKYIQISKIEEPEEKVIKNIKEADHSGNGLVVKAEEENGSLLDSLRKSKLSSSLLSRFRGSKDEPLVNDKLTVKPPSKNEDQNPSEAIFVENQNPDKSGKIVAGWLVVHTEDKQPLTFELFEGDNIIGRPDGPHHVDVLVENDRFVSRIHCVIKNTKDYCTASIIA